MAFDPPGDRYAAPIAWDGLGGVRWRQRQSVSSPQVLFRDGQPLLDPDPYRE